MVFSNSNCATAFDTHGSEPYGLLRLMAYRTEETNAGGGVNLWFIRHAALRLEIRDQDGINYFDGFSSFTRFVAFRFGMTFR